VPPAALLPTQPLNAGVRSPVRAGPHSCPVVPSSCPVSLAGLPAGLRPAAAGGLCGCTLGEGVLPSSLRRRAPRGVKVCPRPLPAQDRPQCAQMPCAIRTLLVPRCLLGGGLPWRWSDTGAASAFPSPRLFLQRQRGPGTARLERGTGAARLPRALSPAVGLAQRAGARSPAWWRSCSGTPWTRLMAKKVMSAGLGG